MVEQSPQSDAPALRATATSPRRRRTGRRIILGLVALVLLLLVLVALAPTLVSWGLGQGIIRGAIEKQINGTVSIDSLKVGWLSDQSIRGLTITDSAGRKAAELNIRARAGLLALALGNTSKLDIDIDGSIRGELRPDGTTSFADLIKDDPAKAPKKPKPPGSPNEPIALPPTTVHVAGLDVHLDSTDSKGQPQPITVKNLTGEIVYAPGQASSAALTGKAGRGYLAGSLDFSAKADGIFDGGGTFKTAGVPVEMKLELRSFPLPLLDTPGELRDFTLTASSSDLTKKLALVLRGEAALDGSPPSHLTGDITIETPFKSDGTPDISLEKFAGSLAGQNVPTPPLQFLFVDSAINLHRDFGPTIDLDARFAAGPTTDITAHAKGQNAELDLVAQVNVSDKSILGQRLVITTSSADPALVAGLTSLRVINPIDVALDLTSFRIPPPDPATGSRPLSQWALTGMLRVKGPAEIDFDATPPQSVTAATLEQHAGPITLSAVDLRLDSAALEQGFKVEGSAVVDDAAITINETITGLFDQHGELALTTARPIGTLTATTLRKKTLVKLAPAQAEIINEAMTAPLNLTVTTTADAGDLAVNIHADGGVLALDLRAAWSPASLVIESAKAVVPLTPRLAALLQDARPDAIVVVEPTTINIEVTEPVTIASSADGKLDFEHLAMKAQIAADGLVLDKLPGAAEPIAMQNLAAELAMQLGEEKHIAVKGRTALSRFVQSGKIAGVRYDIALRPGEEQPIENVVVEMRNLNVNQLETVLGKEAGALSGWLGGSGNITAALAPEGSGLRATVDSDMPRLKGRLVASSAQDSLSINAENASLLLDSALIERTLAAEGSPDASPLPDDEDEGDDDAGEERAQAPAAPAPLALRVEEDLPLSPSIKQLRLPMALLSGEPIDPGLVALDVQLTGGPLKLIDQNNTRFTVSELNLTAQSADIVKGAQFTIAGEVRDENGTETGKLDVKGSVRNLLDPQNRLALPGATVELDAKATGLPTAIPDALARMDGLLVAALGPTVDLSVLMNSFSMNSGKLQGKLTAANGWLEVQAQGRDRMLRIAEKTPAKAELSLTTELRERLLMKIHPVLADIRTARDPLRLTVGGARVPLDGDVSRLRADMELVVGDVEFDSGSATLALLSLFDAQEQGKTIPGRIEPIKAKIRSGVVTYDRFEMKIDKYTLAYSGKIDLVKGSVELRTELPLSALPVAVKELRNVENVMVPIVTRGKFGELKTTIDPKFDLAGLLANEGLTSALEELLKGLNK